MEKEYTYLKIIQLVLNWTRYFSNPTNKKVKLGRDCFHEDDLITNPNENLNALIGYQISGHK